MLRKPEFTYEEVGVGCTLDPSSYRRIEPAEPVRHTNNPIATQELPE
jgi:hypothetical protein